MGAFIGWCFIVLRYDAFEWIAALTTAITMALMFLLTERCAAWVGAPFSTG